MLFTKVLYSHKPVTVDRDSVVEIYINTPFDDKVLKLLLPSHLSLFSLGGKGGERKRKVYFTVWNIFSAPKLVNIHDL
jgi:hypothetical protein